VFCCNAADREVLDYAASELDYTLGVKIKFHKDSGKDVAAFRVYDRSLCQRLQDLGVVPRKSHVDTTMPAFPDECVADFFRGYFDGDGCFCTFGGRASLTLVGTHRLLGELSAHAVRLLGIRNNPARATKQSKKISQVAWSKVSDLRRLHDWMYYPGHCFSLRRKREKFRAFIDSKEDPFTSPTDQ
jgi:hypothetical protein